MPLSLLNHSALALFAQRTRIPTSARSIGFCAIWVCISSSSSSSLPVSLLIPALRGLSQKSERLSKVQNNQDGRFDVVLNNCTKIMGLSLST